MIWHIFLQQLNHILLPTVPKELRNGSQQISIILPNQRQIFRITNLLCIKIKLQMMEWASWYLPKLARQPALKHLTTFCSTSDKHLFFLSGLLYFLTNWSIVTKQSVNLKCSNSSFISTNFFSINNIQTSNYNTKPQQEFLHFLIKISTWVTTVILLLVIVCLVQLT